MNTAGKQDSSARFQYSDLPVAGTHIRLVRVLSAEIDKTVCCELSTWPIETAPPYNAISYTWGDPENTATIVLNDERLTVRANCEYVLRQAHGHDGKAYIWVDALCIN